MEAAFFDLDKTVIAKASMVAFGGPLYREGLISRWLLLRALYGQLVYLYLGADEARLERMKDAVLRLTKGWDQARVRAIVEDALTDVVEPIVFDEALQLIHEHQEAGRKVFIISASPEEIVAPLARYLGVDAHLATLSDLDEEGRYVGTMRFYCYGPAKAEAMRRIAEEQDIDLVASYAYSDSITDLPMLEAVGHPVVVNPDRELARAGRERGWEVRVFRNEVALRSRRPISPPVAIGAAGGTLVAAAAGVGTWWWLQRREAEAAAARTASATATQSVERLWRWASLPGHPPSIKRPGPSWRLPPRGHRG